jgi:hypothetical protein
MKREVILVVALAGVFTAACGALNANPAECSPACSSGTACCLEPTHLSGDAGPSSRWQCVTPDQGACPELP